MRPGSSLPCQWFCTASDVEGRPSCYELASHYALKIMNKNHQPDWQAASNACKACADTTERRGPARHGGKP